MTPEEAYAKALRRIREAEETGALSLNLSALFALNRLPQELADLTSLQELNIAHCGQLRGDLTPLAGLTSLQTLDLSGCWQLSGDLTPLAGLTSLQTLDLSRCWQLRGDLTPLAGLTSLQSLDFYGCKQLSGDLSPLASLDSLQSLDLAWCGQLSGDLSPLARLTSLQSLALALCGQLSGDLSPLARLASLQSLNLSRYKQLSGDLSPLAGLTSLQSLDLSWCRQLSDLSPLADLISLQLLNLARCEQLSGDLSPLTGLTSLQSLDLSWCHQLSDLSPLAGLTSLQLLNLAECSQLSDISLLGGLISLQKLNLSGCKQLSGDLSPLARLASLQSLNLSRYKQLSGDLSPLAGLTSLQSLDLSWCRQLSDLSPLADLISLQLLNLARCEQLSGDLSPLTGLTSLQSLDLSWCHQLSDLSPLAGLTSLQLLNLAECSQLSDISLLGGLISLQKLNLSGCKQLSGDLSPLASLTSLQSLNLSDCKQLSGDLSPLAGLTSLQSLNLYGCGQLSGDLSPLAGLTSLQALNLNCLIVRRFAPIESLLRTLKELSLFGCKLDDLPPEVCGKYPDENVLDKVHAHYEDLKSGQRIDAEVKVLFLGNGGVGKTQLCRRLRGLEFDLSVPTTHGIQLGEMTVTSESFPEPVRLNLWDFGGQDIYHGSHALFLHGQAIFLILWTPELEQGDYQESGLTLRHRPLSYWLDYIRAFAGTDASVLIVQSQCYTRNKRLPHPPATVDDFNSSRLAAVSAKTDLGLNLLKATIQEAVGDCFHRRPPPPIGVGRVAVRDQLRQMFEEDQQREPTQRQHRLLERAEFDRLCAETGRVNDSGALLDFLHHNGVVFYRHGFFGDRIILDQNWALEAIYALFDRKKILPLLRGYGRFSQADLERLIWSDYTVQEQRIFLGMMESCGICFRLRKLPHDPQEGDENDEEEWEYVAPELLPKWSDAQEQLLGRLRDDPPDAEANARYAFLHEGILRGYLSKLGRHAKDAAIYWKYGCWFYEQTTRSQVLIESIWDDAASQAGAGTIRLRGWGQTANNLVEILLQELRNLSTGQAPKISGFIRPGAHALSTSLASNEPSIIIPHVGTEGGDNAKKPLLDQLQITARPEIPPISTPKIFVSYAWGDDSSEEARKRTEIVDRLCETLGQDGWQILRDSEVLRYGDLVSGFMKRIGLADHVIVVLSDKYLRSPYCMTELHYIYQRSLGEKIGFQSCRAGQAAVFSFVREDRSADCAGTASCRSGFRRDNRRPRILRSYSVSPKKSRASKARSVAAAGGHTFKLAP